MPSRLSSYHPKWLLTKELFYGAAGAVVIGLGLGTWLQPPLNARADPDPYAHVAINLPAEPAPTPVASPVSWTPQTAAADTQTGAWSPAAPDPRPRLQPAADAHPPRGVLERDSSGPDWDSQDATPEQTWADRGPRWAPPGADDGDDDVQPDDGPPTRWRDRPWRREGADYGPPPGSPDDN